MSLYNALISGTSAIGNIANYWHIFIMIITLFVLTIVFYTLAVEEDWPPPCTVHGPPPGFDSCVGGSRSLYLIILGFIMLGFVIAIYFSWTLRNDKAFQLVQGVNAEKNIFDRIFKN
jgi:magnesium-transporting ATPase (P-type)